MKITTSSCGAHIIGVGMKTSSPVPSKKKQSEKSKKLGLMQAVRQGNVDRVREILQNNCPSANAEDWIWSASLCRAIKNKRVDVIELLLLRAGSKVNEVIKKNKAANFPLHFAVAGGDEKIVELLLRNHADIRSKNGSGESPLHLACKLGKARIVKLLIDHSASCNDVCKIDNKTPLHFAVMQKNEGLTKLLLERGSEVGARAVFDQTPLHFAAQAGNENIARLLISHGADVNSRMRNSNTPLHVAACNGNFGTVKLLVESGSEVNCTNILQETPLHLAISKACTENGRVSEANKIVEFLLEAKADVNAKDENNHTPLLIAVNKECLSIVKTLLKFEPNLQNTGNVRAFLTAVHQPKEQFQKIVEALQDYGFVIRLHDTRDSFMWDILLYAIKNDYDKIVMDFLRLNPSDATKRISSWQRIFELIRQEPNAKQEKILKTLKRYEDIASHLDNQKKLIDNNSVEEQTLEVIRLTIENGGGEIFNTYNLFDIVGNMDFCDVVNDFYRRCDSHISACDNYGRTALHIASRKGQFCLAKVLMNCGANVNAMDEEGKTPLNYVQDTIRTVRNDYDELYDSIYTSRYFKKDFDDSAKLLIKYMAKMVAENVEVSQRNLQSIKNDPKLNRFYDRCADELQDMKTHYINGSVTAFDILVKNTDRIVMFTRDRNLTKLLKSRNYFSRFPIYEEILEERFRKAKERRDLLDEASVIFIDIFDVQLPHVIKQILSYVDSGDLRRLVQKDNQRKDRYRKTIFRSLSSEVGL